MMQVRCYKKNNKKGDEKSNCQRTRNGRIRIRWSPYDPTVKIYTTPASQKFHTPMGIFSFDQLMSMPLDKIIQMLVILEVAKDAGSYKQTMEKVGIRYDPVTGKLITEKEYVPAIDAFGATKMVKPTREKTRLPQWYLDAEDKAFADANLKKCYGRKPFRCPIDSFAPGLCSPSRKLCYDDKTGEYYVSTGKAAGIRGKAKKVSSEYDQLIGRLENSGGKVLVDNENIDALLEAHEVDPTGGLIKKGAVAPVTGGPPAPTPTLPSKPSPGLV